MKRIWLSLIFGALAFSFSSPAAMSQGGQERGQEGMERAQTEAGERPGQQQTDQGVEEALQKAGEHLTQAGRELQDAQEEGEDEDDNEWF